MALKNGFSLIELIVVIGLLSLLTLAISSTMLMSIVSSSRVRTITKVKQSGGYALGQIQSMIRSSKFITACESTTPSISLVGQDGGSTDIFIETDGSISRIASNSGTYLSPSNMEVSSFTIDCEPTETEPSLIKISFDLHAARTESGIQNPTLHFETSVSTRN